MKLPVYLFAGFLDSGKSTLLRTKVEQGDIPTDGPSLLLLCENGQTGFSPDWCAHYQITPLRFKTPAELTAAVVGAALQAQPYQRVLVEYNGMWDFSLLFRVFSAPDQDVSLFAVAKYACCHSALFPSFAKNLTDLTLGQLRSCDQVFLNRMPPNTDQKPLYDLVRKYTGRAPIIHLKDYVGRKTEKSPYALISADGSGKDDGTAANPADVAFEFRPVGYGCQDVPSLIEAGLEAGAGWFIVEQDQWYNRPALEAAKMSRDYLKSIGM